MEKNQVVFPRIEVLLMQKKCYFSVGIPKSKEQTDTWYGMNRVLDDPIRGSNHGLIVRTRLNQTC